jgi:hypothetical protein
MKHATLNSAIQIAPLAIHIFDNTGKLYVTVCYNVFKQAFSFTGKCHTRPSFAIAMKSIIHFPFKNLRFAASCTLLLAAQLALAQSNDMPPRLERLEEKDIPAAAPQDATPRLPSQEIIEKRERGQTTSVEVRSGNNSYYLKPNDPAGSAEPGEVQGENTRAPQWKILEFDWKRPADQDNPQNQPSPAPAPAPPASGR